MNVLRIDRSNNLSRYKTYNSAKNPTKIVFKTAFELLEEIHKESTLIKAISGKRYKND